MSCRWSAERRLAFGEGPAAPGNAVDTFRPCQVVRSACMSAYQLLGFAEIAGLLKVAKTPPTSTCTAWSLATTNTVASII